MATIEQNILEAEPRESGTKNQARRVRREGKIPGVVYGAGKYALSVSVDPRHVLRILRSDSGHNTTTAISVAGDSTGNALQRSYRHTVHALGSTAQHVGDALHLTKKPEQPR